MLRSCGMSKGFYGTTLITKQHKLETGKLAKTCLSHPLSGRSLKPKTSHTFACFLASDSFLTWFGVFLGFVCDDERLLLVLNVSSSSVWPRFFRKSGVITGTFEKLFYKEYLLNDAVFFYPDWSTNIGPFQMLSNNNVLREPYGTSRPCISKFKTKPWRFNFKTDKWIYKIMKPKQTYNKVKKTWNNQTRKKESIVRKAHVLGH